MSRRVWRGLLTLCAAVVMRVPVSAQAASAAAPVLRRSDVVKLGLTGLGTLALATADRRADAWTRREGTQSDGTLRALSNVGDRTGTYAAMLVGPVTWAAGRVRGDSGLQVMGLRTTEAVGVAGVTIVSLKVLSGRSRPYASINNSPARWDFLGGARSDSVRSFASGHTALSAAAAVVLAAEWRRQGTRGWRTVGPPLVYTLAGVAGGSRIRDRQHWVSDVATGAAVGALSAILVRRWHDAHPRSWLDRSFLRF